MRKIALGLVSQLLWLSPSYGTEQDLESRIKQLESEIAINQEQAADFDHRLNNSVSISGYADVEAIRSSEAGSKPGFGIHHMSLFFKKVIDPKWRFFSEVEYEDGTQIAFEDTGDCTKCSGAVYLESMNFDFAWSPELGFRAGRFFTPAGIWSVDHYPPFVPTQQIPLHIREIFPQVTDGAMVFGSRLIDGSFVNYNLYVGNGESNRGNEDSNSAKAIGAKGSVTLPYLGLLQVGASMYHDKMNDSTTKTVLGLDTKMKIGALSIQSEYAKGKYSPDAATKYDRNGFYAQFLYDIAKLTLGYRFDVYNPDTAKTNAGENVNSLIVNYHVSKDIVLKLEHHLFSFDDSTTKSFNKTIASVAVNLGN